MKSLGKIWILYDKIGKKKSKPLTLVQAQATILNLLSKKNIGHYYLWTPGWKEWAPLEKFLASKQTYFVVAPEPSAVASQVEELTLKIEQFDDDRTLLSDTELPSTVIEKQFTKIVHENSNGKIDYGYYHPDFRAEQIDVNIKSNLNFRNQRKDSPDRRTGTRHNFKIEVYIISKRGKSFKTFSDNISMGGTLLQDPIPREFLNNTFDLVIVNRFEPDTNKARLHFSGRVVGDFKEPRRLMFLDPSAQTRKQLEMLLKSYTGYQEKEEKKTG